MGFFNLITIDGETKCVRDWCRLKNISYGAYYYRVTFQGWAPERAIKTPIDKTRSKKGKKNVRNYQRNIE